jgi:hypothetical protein
VRHANTKSYPHELLRRLPLTLIKLSQLAVKEGQHLRRTYDLLIERIADAVALSRFLPQQYCEAGRAERLCQNNFRQPASQALPDNAVPAVQGLRTGTLR